MSEKTCKNCIDGQCTCKSKKDYNAFEDYIKDLTESDQPACSIEDQENCENCGS